MIVLNDLTAGPSPSGSPSLSFGASTVRTIGCDGYGREYGGCAVVRTGVSSLLPARSVTTTAPIASPIGLAMTSGRSTFGVDRSV